jgi:RND family efflux transporter MFP subunit
MPATICLIAAFALAGPGTQPAKGSVSAATAKAPHCVISIIDEAQVPAREAGDLVSLDVREGAQVQKGQVVAQIDDLISQTKREVAQFDYEAANIQATNKIRIEAAVAGAEVAQAELQMSLDINKRGKGTISESQLNKERLAAKHAKLQIGLANHEFDVAGITSQAKQAQVKASDFDIEHRKIVAPLDGVVVQLTKHKGEWVNPGDAVLRIVRMDKLRVEGFLNAADFSPIEVADRPVTIEVKLARGRVEKFTSTLQFVSPLVEASGEYRIWAEVENRSERGHWLLRPGMEAEMSITLESTEKPASPKLKTTAKE